MSVGTETYGARAYRDPAVLRMLYHDRGLSIRETASVIGCGPTTVHDWMVTYGIGRRSPPPWWATEQDGDTEEAA